MDDRSEFEKRLDDLENEILGDISEEDIKQQEQQEQYDNFWSKRDFLEWTYWCAKSARKNPLALLFCQTDRIISSVSPRVVLPSTSTNGNASLNQFTVYYARSGIGKSSLLDKARSFLDIDGEAEDYPLPSGEGLAELFRATEEGPPAVERARVDIDEGEQIKKAVSERMGTTFWATSRTMWVANKTCGQWGSTRDRQRRAKPHTYRLTLSIYIQESLLGVVLNPEQISYGTPQRFLWASLSDPLRIKGGDRPEPPESRTWSTPRIPEQSGGVLVRNPLTSMVYDPEVKKEIEEIQEAVEDGDLDSVESHTSLLTAKFAAALAIYEHRLYITMEDWELAKWAINASNGYRAQLTRFAHEERQRERRNRAEMEVQYESMQEDIRNQLEQEKIIKLSDKWSMKFAGQSLTTQEIRNRVTKEERRLMNQILQLMLRSGEVKRENRHIGDSQKPSTVWIFPEI